MRECFIERRFQADSVALIDTINGIVESYTRQGFKLSLRQVFYQLVSRNVIENTKQAYSTLGDLVSNARLAGLIDWDAIEDRNRVPIMPHTWDSVSSVVSSAAEGFQLDRWKDQDHYVVVMIEKAALQGVIGPVCRKWQVPFHVNRGYSSSTAMYELGKVIQERRDLGKKDPIVIYAAGDFDPSGVHMTQDVADRLALFSQGPLSVVRVALTWAQIQKYNPPPNYVKMSDSRSSDYQKRYGDKCWEVDALDAGVLARLTEKTILQYLDQARWDLTVEKEDEGKDYLQTLAEQLEQDEK